MAKEIGSAKFDAEVLGEKTLPVLVVFWAPWCGPCRSQGPIIDQFSKQNDGKIKVFKVNVDESGDIAARYGIMSIPTLLVFRDGEIVNKAVGLQNINALKNLTGI